jgi:hypothetical protein
MVDLFVCNVCGNAKKFNTDSLEANAQRESSACPVCDTTGSYERVLYSSGYNAPHLLNIWVRAPSLERVAGCAKPIEALRAAMMDADVGDSEDLRDVAALIELRLHELDVLAMSQGDSP